MARTSIVDRLFLFLWHRYVEGQDPDVAAEAAGISEEEFIAHRARRSHYYRAAEERLDHNLPPEMLRRYALAVQARILLRPDRDSTAAQVATRVLDAAAGEDDRPTAIAFIVEDAELAERMGGLAQPSAPDGDHASAKPPAHPAAPSAAQPFSNLRVAAMQSGPWPVRKETAASFAASKSGNPSRKRRKAHGPAPEEE